MNASGAEAALRDFEAAAFAEEQVRGGHAHVLEGDFRVAVRRVVVEPDVRNDRIAALNAAAGFVVARTVDLPDKTAALGFCSREAFTASALGGAA